MQNQNSFRKCYCAKRVISLFLVFTCVMSSAPFASILPSPISPIFQYGTADQGKTAVGEPFGLCHAGYSNNLEEYTHLLNMGNQWNRIDFSWSGVEPSNDVWTYDRLDHYVNNASLYNHKIIAILDYDVDWLNVSGEYKEVRPYIKHDHIPYFLDYVNQTVHRYMDRVAAFEIWNEPNLSGFWKGTREEFFDLFKQTATLINNIDPNIVIVGGVLSGHDPNYIEAMFEAGLMEHVDVISFHPYSGNVGEIYFKCQEIKAVGDKYGFKGDYWITEVGNPTGGTYGHAVNPHELSNRVIKTFVYATINDIKQITWYCLYDASDELKATDPDNSEWYFGLLYPNNTWKPGAYAFGIFSKAVSNSEYRPDLVHKRLNLFGNALQVYAYRRANGETALVLWFEDFVLAYEKIVVHLEIATNANPVFQYDIYDGSATEIGESNVISLAVSNEPTVITYQTDDNESIISVTADEPWVVYIFIIGLPVLLIVGVVMKKKSRYNVEK